MGGHSTIKRRNATPFQCQLDFSSKQHLSISVVGTYDRARQGHRQRINMVLLMPPFHPEAKHFRYLIAICIKMFLKRFCVLNKMNLRQQILFLVYCYFLKPLFTLHFGQSLRVVKNTIIQLDQSIIHFDSTHFRY